MSGFLKGLALTLFLSIGSFLILKTSINAQAAANPSQITFSSTTSWQQVSTLPALPIHRIVVVENYTDGDIQVAFGSTDYPDFVVKQNTDKVLSSFNSVNTNAAQDLKAPMYVRNISGTGGTVYIKTMPSGIAATTRGSAGSSSGSITPVAPGGAVFDTRYFDAASTNINESSGAFVAVGSAVSATVQTVHVTTTIGEPLNFASGANCTSPTQRWIVNRGEGPLVIGVSVPSGQTICVKSLSAASVSSGEIVINLLKAP